MGPESHLGSLTDGAVPSRRASLEDTIVGWTLALGVVLISAAALGFFAWRLWAAGYTTDYPWLLQTGRHMLDTGAIPAGDIFSWTRTGEPWVLYQWLFEAVVAGLDRLLGEPGLFVLFAGFGILVHFVALLCGAVPRRVSAAFVLLPAALGLLVVTINLSLRPMIVTSALLLAQYVIVQRLRRGESSLAAAIGWLAPCYVLWGNTHTGVVLGLGSLLLFALGDLAERFRIWRFEPDDPAIEGRALAPGGYVLLVAVAFGASLLNPYGFAIYRYIAELSGQSYLNSLIEELRSPNFHLPRFGWFLVFAGLLFALMARARRSLSASDLLHLAALTVATLYSARFVVWAVLLYMLILPRAAHHCWIAGGAGAGAVARSVVAMLTPRRPRLVLACIGLVLPMLAAAIAGAPPHGDCERLAPALAAYARIAQPADRLFNDPGFGSCSIAVAPERPVFIDTRFDFYGTEFVRQTIETLRLRPGWEALLMRWRIDVLLIDRMWPLAQALAADAGYETLFEDPESVLLRRRQAWPAAEADGAAP